MDLIKYSAKVVMETICHVTCFVIFFFFVCSAGLLPSGTKDHTVDDGATPANCTTECM